jgi:hypothetical protein
VLEPILKRIETHVFAAERLHGDDTTVPVLAKGMPVLFFEVPFTIGYVAELLGEDGKTIFPPARRFA